MDDSAKTLPILAAREVTKTYYVGSSAVSALSGFSLEVKQGEIVALLGRSGCGKSTLLKIAAGLEAPDSGLITLSERPISTPSPDTAIVFQESRLFPWLTIHENIRLGRPIETSYIDSLLEMVDLSGIGDRYPGSLSGGMSQRVAVLRAMAGRPKLILMDEPFNALDYYTRSNMVTLYAKWCINTHTSVLIVTHDLDEALFLADRLVVMAPGGHQKAEVVNSISAGKTGIRDRELTDASPDRTILRRLLSQP